MKNTGLISFILLVAIAFTAPSCKSKKKNTALKRAYHNVTAHYNGYFNAKMRVDNVARQTEATFNDSYDQLLPVFKISSDETAVKGNNQPLDEAIKKASLVIQRHEISRWIDDCYLVIGRAYFYKKDYFTAIESFQYVAGRYKGKESGNEAYIWLIKSYLQLKKMQQAESVMNVALASEKFPKEHLSELFAASAAFYIAKSNYPKAIEYLDKSLKYEKQKAKKSRYTYILAQLYEKNNEPDKASLYFQKVVKMNPSYDMAFNARINSARLFESKTLANKKIIEKELLKMLKDDKNKEFKDQIYYSLGNISEKDKNEEKAIEYFKLASASSVKNNAQKGKAFLKLATIYYTNVDYENAQLYYDSTSTFLPSDHPDYNTVVLRRNSLTKLVTNLKVIKREDSLQALARLSEKELLAAVDKIIDKDDEAKRLKDKQEQELRDNLALANTQSESKNQNNPAPGGNTAGNTWYFYNTSAMSMGYTDFVKKFGRRALEDNWRRANKESFASVFGGEEETSEESAGTGGKGEKTDPVAEKEAKRKKYLKNVPVSAEQLAASNDKIIQAYYNIGIFYKEELVNTKESVNYFESLLRRFPDNKMRVETYFNLYRLYTSLNNTKQADYYKNKILNDYPNSLFARVIEDPSYTSEAYEIDKKAQVYYASVYNQYLSGDYQGVLSHKAFVDTAYAITSIGPKYSYLYALSIAKTNGVDALEKALNDLVNKHPSSEAASAGRDLLQKIAEMRDPSLKVKQEEPSPFEVETKAKYYFMLTADVRHNQRETKIEFAKFIEKQFSLDKPKITSELIGDTQQALFIKQFSDLAKANEFLSAVNKQADELIKIPKGSYTLSLISEKNYSVLMEKKDVKKYLQFYQSNYKSNE